MTRTEKSGTLLAGVIGHPIEHSLSPDIFDFLSKRAGVALEYRKLPVSAREFRRTLSAAARSSNFRGWNVTIPHKERAASQVHRLEPAARALGAVNVIRFHDRSAWGYNTDVFGVRETFRRCDFSCRGKTAVIYGAGGGAAAVAFALGLEGTLQVFLFNRTGRRARDLALKMRKIFPKTSYSPIQEIPTDADLYVNATPLGMSGFPASPRLPKLQRPRDALVFDLVYRPLETKFLKSGRKQGTETANGLDMLIAQAIATWKIWFGNSLSSENQIALQASIRRKLLRILRAREKASV